MLLETEITIADYREFLNMVKKKNLKFSPVWFIIYALVSFLFITVYIVLGMSIHLPTAFAIAVLIFILASTQLYWNKKKLQPERDSFILGRKTYKIDADGIHASRKNVEMFVKWPGVKTVPETGTHFFIMLDSLTAFIIPKRSFSGEEQMREFKGLIGGNVGSS